MDFERVGSKERKPPRTSSGAPRAFKTASCPKRRATSTAVSPAWLKMSLRAPISSSHCTIARWPCPAALCSGVLPTFVYFRHSPGLLTWDATGGTSLSQQLDILIFSVHSPSIIVYIYIISHHLHSSRLGKVRVSEQKLKTKAVEIATWAAGRNKNGQLLKFSLFRSRNRPHSHICSDVLACS